jgi:hypothetical protein
MLRAVRCYIARALAPAPRLTCSDRGATVQLHAAAVDVWTRWCAYP